MRTAVLAAAGCALWLGCQLAVPLAAEAALQVTVTGSVRLNVIWSDRIVPTNAGGSGQIIAPTDIPFDEGPARVPERDHSQTTLDARRTRLQIDIKDEVGGIKLTGRLQGDFLTTDGNARVSNSRHFRIRLGYGQATTPGGVSLRFGQTRTMLSEYGDNLIGGVAVSGVLNENDSFAQLQARQPAIHVSWMGKMPVGDLTVGLGVEKHSLNNLGSALVAEDQGEGQDVPLFTGGVRYRSPLLSAFVRGAGAKSRVILPGGGTESEPVWIGAAGVDLKPIQLLRLYGQYYYSDGLNRLNGTFGDAVLCTVAAACVPNTLEPLRTQGFHAGIQLLPTKDLELNAVYQWLKAEDDLIRATGANPETALRKVQAVNVNFIYKFWTRFDTGVEYMRAWVDSFGESDGTANFVNFRLRFYF
jgi:hypothetical protein